MSPSNRFGQIYCQTPGSLFFAFYVSQGYSGGILKRLNPGEGDEFPITQNPICQLLLEFEVLTTVIMNSSIFWDITPCSTLKVN
jgi:hypothetical protein